MSEAFVPIGIALIEMGCGASLGRLTPPPVTLPSDGQQDSRPMIAHRPAAGARGAPSVPIEEMTLHLGWHARPGEITGGGRQRPQSEVLANERYERFCMLWPAFSDACFEASVKAVHGGILPRVDIVNRHEYLWLAIPRIALTHMLLRSMTQDGLRIGDSGVLSSNFVPAQALPLYIELCTIKQHLASSGLSQLEIATLRRIVVHGGAHSKSREWIEAMGGVMACGPSNAFDTFDGGAVDGDEGYVSAEDSGSRRSLDSNEEGFLAMEPLGVGREQHWRQKTVLQLAARCQNVLEPMASSSRFALDISKVLTRVDEALAPTTFARRTLVDSHMAELETPSPAPSPAPPAEFDAMIFSGTRHRWHRGKMVGIGAYGKVFAAWHLDVNGGKGRRIALKEIEIMGQHAGRVEREISILSALSHPHIISLFGSERTETMLFILMEFAVAGSLAHVCASRSGLAEKLVRKYLVQMLLGLEYLHSNSIVHRDIKGANCLLFPPPVGLRSGAVGADTGFDDGDMMVKLADFGASRMFDGGKSLGTGSASVEQSAWSAHDVSNSSSGRSGVHGTANWMAPEVILNQRPGRGADIWSLGATAIEMFTGKAPFSGLPQVTVMYRIAKEGQVPDIPAGVSEKARSFITECLKREPERRPRARQLMTHAWLRSPGVEARTRVLRLITEEIESLSDAVVTSSDFSLEKVTLNVCIYIKIEIVRHWRSAEHVHAWF